MKNWIRSVLPALSVAGALSISAGVLFAGNVAAAATTSGHTASAAVAGSLPPAAATLLQSSIDRQIAEYGGVQISPYEVAYNDGDPIMVFANPLTGQFPTDAANRAESAATPLSGTAAGGSHVVRLATSYRYGCPYTSASGWTCFYQNNNFNAYSCSGGTNPPCSDGGRLLQFQSCGTQSLATYGFSDQTSSWVNNTNSYVSVYASSGTALWSESPGGASAYVGAANNDKADHFWIIC